MGKKLTDKQEVFCHEYIVDFNRTQAAIRAGYSENSAKEIGCQNLTKLNIQDRIEELIQERIKRVEKNGDDVVNEYIKLAFSNISDYLNDDFSFKPLSDVRNSEAIAGIKVTENKDGSKSIEFKLHDKKGSLQDLGKHYGVFEKDNAQKNPYKPEPPAPKTQLPDEWEE